MKKLLAILLALSLALVAVACGKAPEATEKTDQADGSSATLPEGSEDTTTAFKVGFVVRTQDSPYYVALTKAVVKYCEDLGWDIAVLDSSADTEKEAQNVDAFISQGVDLLFLDAVVPDPAVPVINKAAEAGIPVINLDTGVGEEANDITTVYSDNEQNGRLVGIAYAKHVGADDAIKAILLSGNKGSVAGRQRRMGIFTGVLETRLNLSEEEAWKLSEEIENQLLSNGKAKNEEAKFEIVGQGWGAWTEEGGLEAAEDLITANPDLTVVIAENDQMNFGAITALANASLEGIDIIAGADGAIRAYDLIREGKYFATGENSPIKVAKLGVEIAKEILVDGANPDDYPEITFTEAVAVTAENVDQYYEYGF